MIVDYKCKFCGVPGSVEVEDNDATQLCLDKWKNALCCERCNKFKLATRKINDATKQACAFLIQFRLARVSKLSELEMALKPKLERLVQRFTEVACNHYRTSYEFDPAFAVEIMNQPSKWQSVFIVLESAIRRSRHAKEYVLHESKTPYVD